MYVHGSKFSPARQRRRLNSSEAKRYLRLAHLACLVACPKRTRACPPHFRPKIILVTAARSVTKAHGVTEEKANLIRVVAKASLSNVVACSQGLEELEQEQEQQEEVVVEEKEKEVKQEEQEEVRLSLCMEVALPNKGVRSQNGLMRTLAQVQAHIYTCICDLYMQHARVCTCTQPERADVDAVCIWSYIHVHVIHVYNM